MLAFWSVGCGEPEPEASRPAEPTGMWVRERLAPADFGLEANAHGPVASIGAEARPVLRATGALRVGSAFGLAADAEGRVRAEIALPPELGELPVEAFGLGVQRLPGDVPEVVRARLAAETFTRRVTEGWSLSLDDRVATVEYDADGADAERRYNLHLSAYPAERLRVASRAFEVESGFILELGYGLAAGARPQDEGRGTVRFEARLGCGDGEPDLLVDERVERGSPPRWRSVSVPLDTTGPCRLGLEAAAPGGRPVRGALWEQPRILGPAAAGPVPPNLVMISLDTLRADHLSGYGYPRPTSPSIDAELIGRGTTFLDVTTTYSRTDVSHMSLLTGLYPAARPEPGRLHPETPLPLLTERLAAAGFQTAAFAEDALLAGSFGFWFGFDRFVERSLVGVDRGGVTFADAHAWLRGNADRRFFLFVHTYKTHAPYAASPSYAELFRDPSDWRNASLAEVPEESRPVADEYDRTIREADDLVAGLLGELDALGLSENTLVVLLSDHGEAFGEHRGVGHSTVSHQEVMRVPLVLRGPGVPAGLRIETPVSLVDVAPTLLDLLGLPPLATTQGISLRPALESGTLPAKRPLFFSWLQKKGEGIRYGVWKYHGRALGGLLYNLEDDPGEREPQGARLQDRPYVERLFADHAERSSAIRERLTVDGDGSPPGSGAPPDISPEMEESLRALGYIE